jgi:hypothetical protein
MKINFEFWLNLTSILHKFTGTISHTWLSEPAIGKVQFPPLNQILGSSSLFNEYKRLLTLWGHAAWHKKSWVESPAIRVACQRVFFSAWLSHATIWVHTSPKVHHRVTMHIPHSKYSNQNHQNLLICIFPPPLLCQVITPLLLPAGWFWLHEKAAFMGQWHQGFMTLQVLYHLEVFCVIN